jgi:hypothetical protein
MDTHHSAEVKPWIPTICTAAITTGDCSATILNNLWTGLTPVHVAVTVGVPDENDTALPRLVHDEGLNVWNEAVVAFVQDKVLLLFELSSLDAASRRPLAGIVILADALPELSTTAALTGVVVFAPVTLKTEIDTPAFVDPLNVTAMVAVRLALESAVHHHDVSEALETFVSAT